MRIFRCGEEKAVQAHLRAFIIEMDDRGVAYGHSGDGPNDEPQTAGIGSFLWELPDDDEFQVLLIVSGEALVSGEDGVDHTVRSGHGVMWQPSERRALAVVSELRYLEAESQHVTVEHFEDDS